MNYITKRLRQKIRKFLITNKSSVCATVWGHGGVGKTATVQSLCEDLIRGPAKHFDYIAFISAKDRRYDHAAGRIEPLPNPVKSYEAVVGRINEVIATEDPSSDQAIIDCTQRILIVLDDYGTFTPDDKLKLEELIRRMDVSHHKVLITTRAAVVIGDEFQSSELDKEGSRDFLLEAFRNELPDFNADQIRKELEDPTNIQRVFEVCGGRPLFILQFMFVRARQEDILSALRRPIQQSSPATEFLFGRIYDYLSQTARDMFAAIGQLVTRDNLRNLVDRIHFVLDIEPESDQFKKALSDLVKLRMIEVEDDRVFKVYSPEILHSMRTRYDQREASFKDKVRNRLSKIRFDKSLDNEQPLPPNADAARATRSEGEVIRNYRHILNRARSPVEIRVRALLNLAEYLFNARGKQHQALEEMKKHEGAFGNRPEFVRILANYC